MVVRDEECRFKVTECDLKKRPTYEIPTYAFTEHGILMLSSALNSERAIQVNIAIMRAFVRLREAMASNKEFSRKLDELEKRIASHDENIRTLFQAIRQLMAPKETPVKKIGFQLREKRAAYTTYREARKSS